MEKILCKRKIYIFALLKWYHQDRYSIWNGTGWLLQVTWLELPLTDWFFACSWYQCWVYANLFGWSVMPNCLQQEETWSWGSSSGLWWSWFCSSATLLQALLDYQELMGSNVGRERLLQDLPWAWRMWSQHHGFSSCCQSWCLNCFGLVLITKFPSLKHRQHSCVYRKYSCPSPICKLICRLTLQPLPNLIEVGKGAQVLFQTLAGSGGVVLSLKPKIVRLSRVVP